MISYHEEHNDETSFFGLIFITTRWYHYSMWRSGTVCRVCGISARRLDYWISSKLAAPTKTYRAQNPKRDFFLFGFDAVLRIRIIKSLRDAGVSLQRIREAITRIGKDGWQAHWLVSDGRDVYRIMENNLIEYLSGRHQ